MERSARSSAIAKSLSATACSDSEDGVNGPAPAPLLGTWVSTSLMADGVELTGGGLTLTVTFSDDGTFSTSTVNDAAGVFCETETSCTDGGTLTFRSTQFTFDPGLPDEATLNYTISGTVLTVSGDLDGTAAVLVFDRQ